MNPETIARHTASIVNFGMFTVAITFITFIVINYIKDSDDIDDKGIPMLLTTVFYTAFLFFSLAITLPK